MNPLGAQLPASSPQETYRKPMHLQQFSGSAPIQLSQASGMMNTICTALNLRLPLRDRWGRPTRGRSVGVHPQQPRPRAARGSFWVKQGRETSSHRLVSGRGPVCFRRAREFGFRRCRSGLSITAWKTNVPSRTGSMSGEIRFRGTHARNRFGVRLQPNAGEESRSRWRFTLCPLRVRRGRWRMAWSKEHSVRTDPCIDYSEFPPRGLEWIPALSLLRFERAVEHGRPSRAMSCLGRWRCEDTGPPQAQSIAWLAQRRRELLILLHAGWTPTLD